MAGNGGIQLQLSGFDRTQGVDAAAGGIHLTGQDAIAGTGGQTEAAMHAGVGGTRGEARQLGR